GIAYTKAELTAYMTTVGVFTLVAESRLKGDGGTEQTEESKAPSIAGFIIAQSNRKGMGHIITIDVLAEARRSGIGSSLLAAAEQRLRNINCHHVRLETAIDNVAAQKFYERHEYAIVKTIARYYSNGTDAFVLEKTL
ncbi:MAG: GNAT family N-acetyltransferase, partial [Terriglobales bacterium]